MSRSDKIFVRWVLIATALVEGIVGAAHLGWFG